MIDKNKLSVKMSTKWHFYTSKRDCAGRLVCFFYNSMADGPFYMIQIDGKSSDIYTDIDVAVNVFNKLVGG